MMPYYKFNLSSVISRKPFFGALRIRRLALSSLAPNWTYLTTLCLNGPLNEALLEMAKQGLEMKFKDYDTLLNQCVKQRAYREGQRVHSHMIKTHYEPPVYLRTRLIVLYVKCDCLMDARYVFDEMPERNVVSWTAMVSGYAQNGHCLKALDLFVEMLREGAEPNEFTFTTILRSCIGKYGLFHGMQIHSLLVKYPFGSHLFVGSSLLDMYAKAGRTQEALIIFEGLPERDVVSCTSIISGFAQQGLNEEALVIFRKLQIEGMNFNYVTYVSILTALSGLAAIELGRQVHGHVLRLELPFFVVLQNSLIDMYSKCGHLDYSRRIFNSIPEKTIVSWNAMLVGYSRHGMGKEVVELYDLLKEVSGVRPNNVTVLAVLSGCSHGGMELKGLEIFDEIFSEDDGFELTIEHYACVVDLLGRSGQLDRALQFIKQMPLEPNAAIWGSLLGACRFHQNASIGKIAGNRLLGIEPENAGNYVVLANLYASAGRWEEVRSIREMMKRKSVVKVPGKSWIEVDQTLHTFLASDQAHPRKEEILQKVRDMSVRIKGVGYVPAVSCVLHDVDDEQKEKLLLGHSEKLALAFGLIASQGKPIRVIKNLRICVDCHNFAKFVSQVYSREVTLRDNVRFHHIVDGECSCGDYW
ncbi:OLC1v1037018C1 [Oldenlandia corymbosa var. corymbosa]|uniref:OLC1v1037018C1 n=1 Tax=Oldenlandia corymbosa var. corymbosa TaxID=529605 RepID=A0AAV1CXV3_OLDCO|nr:OLC1v1037018C1 [Oldenlandia corymbosa var. corymbosa]